MAATLPSLKRPSPHERTKAPSLLNSMIGCAPRWSTRIVPVRVAATEDTWIKFQAPGTPAAVVGGAGHSSRLYRSGGISRWDRCAPRTKDAPIAAAHELITSTAPTTHTERPPGRRI